MDRAGNEEGLSGPDQLQSAGHDLLLLMADLAQLDDPGVVERLFIETLNRIFAPLTIEKAGAKSAAPDRRVEIEIATARRSFGGIAVQSDGDEVGEQTVALLRNAAQMVAVILENSVNRAAAISERDKFFDISDDLLCVTEVGGAFLQVNPAWQRTLGWPRAELLGRSFMDLVHPDDTEMTRKAMETLAAGNPVRGFQNRYRRRDGSHCWLEWTSIPDDGKLYAVARDVTDRRRTEEALRQSEDRFSKVFMFSPAAMAMTRLVDSLYYDVNTKWLSVLGYSRDEVIGKTSIELGIWEDTEQRAAFIKRARRDGSVHGFEATFLTKDGRRRTIVLAGETLEIGGELSLLGAFYDITDRKDMERALRESEERFRRLYEESPLPYQSLDLTGRIVEVNQAWLDLLGYGRGEALGRCFREFMAEGQRPAFEKNFAGFIAAGEIHDPVYELTCKDGSVRTVTVDGRVGRGLDGAVRQTHCVLTDITERLRTEERLRQAQKMEAVGQLAGGTAHDFNNLLQVIMSNLDLLSHMLAEGDQGQILLDNALKAVRRGARLTQQLLSFSRRQALRPEIVHPAALIRGMLDMLARTLGEDIEVETTIEDHLPAIVVDPHALENALLNIAINARAAMPRGGRLTVWAGRKHIERERELDDTKLGPGDYVEISLTDTGLGMSEEVMARAFEPFFTTKEVGQGSGLGLSMVYGFIKQSRGAVSLESHLGKGTVVRILLPAA